MFLSLYLIPFISLAPQPPANKLFFEKSKHENCCKHIAFHPLACNTCKGSSALAASSASLMVTPSFLNSKLIVSFWFHHHHQSSSIGLIDWGRLYEYIYICHITNIKEKKKKVNSRNNNEIDRYICISLTTWINIYIYIYIGIQETTHTHTNTHKGWNTSGRAHTDLEPGCPMLAVKQPKQRS
jgi:hypothetical protein